MTSQGKNWDLKKAFINIEKSLQVKLDHAFFPDHPVAKGDVAEHAWRSFLINSLPSRYKIGSGFVIDSHSNKSEQIDCIIYENIYTPTLWGEENYIYIPAEAVHAVFEIKQKVNKKFLIAASRKIESVRKLHRTSASYIGSGHKNPPKECFHIIGGLFAKETEWKGGFRSKFCDKAIKNIHGNIDIVLTARNGFIDYFNTGFPCSEPPVLDEQEGSVLKGIFRLMQALQAQGTVVAIDLNYYKEEIFKVWN